MLNHLEDLARKSFSRGIGLDSDFLTPEEYTAFVTNCQRFAYASPTVIDPDRERKLIHFGPGQADIALLAIHPANPKFAALRHPDYLGAMLALGLERRVIGDIIVLPDCAYGFVKAHIAGFIAENLTQVARCAVQAKPVAALPEEARPHLIAEALVLSSLRLDCFIAAAFHLSRTRANEVIEAGLVFLDGKCLKKPAVPVPEGSQISLRRMGKIRFDTVLRRTKKSSVVVAISRWH